MLNQKGIFALLSEHERKYLKEISKRYTQEILDYSECFDLLNDAMRHIADVKLEIKEDFKLSDVTIFTVCNRIIGTSKTYLDLQLRGYKFDANIIMRSMLENIELLDWLVKDEKNANRWLDGKIEFKVIRKELGLYSNKKFLQAYDGFCDYVHSNFKALTDLFQLSEQREILDEKGTVRRMTTLIIEPDTENLNLDEDSLFPSIGYSALNALKEKYLTLLKPEIKSRIDNMFEKINERKHNS
jgi:hypothetical protein